MPFSSTKLVITGIFLYALVSAATRSLSTTISQWKIFCSIHSSKLSATTPANLPCVRFEILLGEIRESIGLEMNVDLLLRLMVIDWRFCNTFPKRSESVFAVSPTTCPKKILPTVFITTAASLSVHTSTTS